MKEIITEVEIGASAESVWRIFADFDRYPTWNPFIKSVVGKVEAGQVIQIALTPPDAKSMTFNPKVLTFQIGSELSWIGHLLIPGLFDGEHSFKVIDLGNGRARFIQREAFRGILVPFMQAMLDNNTKRGFVAMNEALKALCESAGE